MLGFATVDVSLGDQTLTVWLTSMVTRAEIGHTNAVSFPLADETTSQRAWGMTRDRYVVLTNRSPRDHPLLAGWGVVPCDVEMLAKQTAAAQDAIMTAFAAYVATKRGKAADLAEPTLAAIPPPLDQATLGGLVPAQLTLAVANQVRRTWEAWYTTELERVKRWKHMPGGREGEKPAPLPAEYAKHNVLQPVRAWAQ